MTLIKAENRELTHSRYSSTKGIPTTSPKTRGTGLLLGTDFRHAVEFSRSGRTAIRPSRAFVTGGLSNPYIALGCSPLRGPIRCPPGPARCMGNSTRSFRVPQGGPSAGPALSDVDHNTGPPPDLPVTAATCVSGRLPDGGPTDLLSVGQGSQLGRRQGASRSVRPASRRESGGTSGDPTWAELDADARAHGLGRLGDAVLPGALAGPTHHHQVPVTQREPEAPRAPARRAEHERPRGAERDDRDQRVRGAAPADPVAVPGDAVATVPVEAHADRDEVLAQFGAVVPVELRPRLRQQRVRQFLVTPVVPEQARHGDLALVHLPAVLPPGDVAEQVLQHRVGPGDPAGQVIHPGTATELVSHDPAGQWGERRLLGEIPHRGLVHERHGGTLPRFRTCVRKAVDAPSRGTAPSRRGAGALFRRSAPGRTAAPPGPPPRAGGGGGPFSGGPPPGQRAPPRGPRPAAPPPPRRSWPRGSRPGRPRGAPPPPPTRAARAGPHRRRSAPTHPPAGRRCCRPDVRWARRG